MWALASIAVIIYVTLRIVKNPEELPIYAFILSSTLPAIVMGNWFAYGVKGDSIRFEYVVFILGVFLAFFSKKHRPPSRGVVGRAVLAMLLVNVATIFVSIYWRTKMGIGTTIRLLETYMFYFIVVRLTQRRHIAGLLNALITVTAAISGLFVVISVTNSRFLIRLINPPTLDVFSRAKVFEGNFFGDKISMVLTMYFVTPIMGAVTFFLALVKKKERFYYALLSLLFLVHTALSGERGYALMLLAGLLASVAALYLAGGGMKAGYRAAAIIICAASALYCLYAYTGFFGDRTQYMVSRLEKARAEQQSRDMLMGQVHAKEELSEGGAPAWIAGFGGYRKSRIAGIRRFQGGSTGYDVNGPILMILRYGVTGLAAIVILLLLAFRRTFSMLRRLPMTAEENAVVFGVLLWIVMVSLSSAFRGFEFSENFTFLSCFVILLGWSEVIWRDYGIARLNDGFAQGPAMVGCRTRASYGLRGDSGICR